MSGFGCLEDIEVWRAARAFAGDIYAISSKPPFSRDFSLVDQIRRAGNSISLNIAEGFGLFNDKEFRRHLTIARGSTPEVKGALYLAFDRSYISDKTSDKTLEEMKKKSERLARRISSLMVYLAEG